MAAGDPGLAVPAPRAPRRASFLASHPVAALAAALLAVFVIVAIAAPYLSTVDPKALAPRQRMQPPLSAFLLGTDQFGRDVWSRVAYGARVSLVVAVAVATLSILVGTLVGVVSGYVRWLDGIIMRIMDGLMAIPSILLAVALVSLSGASRATVILAIAIPEIPRVVRLVRSVVLSAREEPYVEAAISVGTPRPTLIWRHILPNCVPPLIVQATYTAAYAMLTEAILSFLGAGTPPEFPSWGNMMAEGRTFFPIAPHIVLIPGIALALTILAVNVLGDALRDRLDPKLARRTGGLR